MRLAIIVVKDMEPNSLFESQKSTILTQNQQTQFDTCSCLRQNNVSENFENRNFRTCLRVFFQRRGIKNTRFLGLFYFKFR